MCYVMCKKDKNPADGICFNISIKTTHAEDCCILHPIKHMMQAQPRKERFNKYIGMHPGTHKFGMFFCLSFLSIAFSFPPLDGLSTYIILWK